jgi:mannose-6-phosphate isomerase
MDGAAVFKLTPTVQSYEWGKIGRQSKVAQLAEAGKAADLTVEDHKPYAEVCALCPCRRVSISEASQEMWMGTHSTSPSLVHGSHRSLKDHLTDNAHLIGPKVSDAFKSHAGDVPFLFKVLSVHKALSIQTHPDKATAEKLHAEQPHIYKGAPSTPPCRLLFFLNICADDNHKPEMAVALTPFTALCGFRPLSEIATYLSATPEFAELIPHAIASKFIALASTSTPEGPEEKAALRDLFAAVMTAHPFAVQTQLAALVERYKTRGGHSDEETDVVDLVLTLSKDFPDDIGIFCVYLLNYVKLHPKEAIFLGAGEPHAYLSGGSCPPLHFIRYISPIARHHGMHGDLRQRHSGWPHS